MLSSRYGRAQGQGRVCVSAEVTGRWTGRQGGAWSAVPMALVLSVAIMILWVVVASPAPAHAAEDGAVEASATDMDISVWPEYDDPRVLVIYQGNLDPGVTLPVEVEFNFPKGAEIGMACEVNPSGGHACKPYQLTDHGDYQTLSYQVESYRKIFFEYYYEPTPGFPGSEPLREFDYTFRPGFPVGSVNMEIQEPKGAQDFQLDPEFSNVSSDSQGMNYYSRTYTDVQVGETKEVSVSYQKDGSEPSVTPGDAGSTGGGAIDQASQEGEGGNSTLIAVVAVLAFGALTVGGYVFFKPASASVAGSRRRGSRSSASRGQGAQSGPAKTKRKKGGAGTKYCTECGLSLQESARFCSGCGSEQSG